MSSSQKYLFILFLILTVFMFSGCAILQIPGKIIGGTFSLIGQILKIVGKLPKPPPGVF